MAGLAERVAGALGVTRTPFLSEKDIVCSHNLLCGSFPSYPLQEENLVKILTVRAEVYLTKSSKYFKGRSLKSHQLPEAGAAQWVLRCFEDVFRSRYVVSWPVFLNLPWKCGAPLGSILSHEIPEQSEKMSVSSPHSLPLYAGETACCCRFWHSASFWNHLPVPSKTVKQKGLSAKRCRYESVIEALLSCLTIQLLAHSVSSPEPLSMLETADWCPSQWAWRDTYTTI